MAPSPFIIRQVDLIIVGSRGSECPLVDLEGPREGGREIAESQSSRSYRTGRTSYESETVRWRTDAFSDITQLTRQADVEDDNTTVGLAGTCSPGRVFGGTGALPVSLPWRAWHSTMAQPLYFV